VSTVRIRILLLVSALVCAVATPALAGEQDDAGSHADAGGTFDTATPLVPRGAYAGRLDAPAGDVDDYYKFHLDEGASVTVIVDPDEQTTDPVTLLDPSGTPLDVGLSVLGGGASAGSALAGTSTAIRLAVPKAPVSGDYRLHLQARQFAMTAYGLCFANCEGPRDEPIQFIFGGSLRSPVAKVLLVPPAHGDLGNPLGPTVLDYLDATLRGIRKWEHALAAFAADFPQYSYLRDIDVRIEVFDSANPVDPAGYDVVVGYVAAGPAFRGVAAQPADVQFVRSLFASAGLHDVHFGGRFIALSLFGSSPRAGQILYDFPEVSDLEIVTSHEFGHTFGLGHTRTWHPVLGPDVMNSPAPFVYGDGFPAGDGGERTQMKCLTSLDLYAMATLYRWIPSGEWAATSGATRLPPEIPYGWYC
jgi:hypothetical protein